MHEHDISQKQASQTSLTKNSKIHRICFYETVRKQITPKVLKYDETATQYQY